MSYKIGDVLTDVEMQRLRTTGRSIEGGYFLEYTKQGRYTDTGLMADSAGVVREFSDSHDDDDWSYTPASERC